jgi:type IV secretory pathway VirB6-like protein
LLFGFGAILLPAIWINGAIAPLPKYSKVRDIVFALVISAISAVLMYIIGFSLAWGILG